VKQALDRAMFDLMQRVADKAILPRYQSLADGEIIAKAPGDVVTVADHESEAILSEALSVLEPGVAIVGEEAAHADTAVQDALSGDCWIIDPLDGTRNFAAGKPPFGIIIARSAGGLCQSGWLYDCLTGRFCAAHHGLGAFIDGERIAAQSTGAMPPVAAISMVFMEETRREAVKAQIAPHYTLVDIPYCAAEQYPRLALGTNDVSIFERTLAWDHAAGVLWLNEAGGKAARPDGSPYRVDEWARPGLIGAASPALWDGLAARMAALS
jgi:fructose-1,6-bisphosphatase/inositol monophosphatase family enzyme